MFKPLIPVMAVIGGKASGKTTAVEIIVKALTDVPLSVMTVKHVSQTGFTLDREGTDSWRHWKSGAKIVSLISDSEKAIMIKNQEQLDLNEFNLYSDQVDVIVFEGFSSLLLKEERIGKIICLKDWSEKESYLTNLRGKVIAFCSLKLQGNDVLRFGHDDKILAERAIQYATATK